MSWKPCLASLALLAGCNSYVVVQRNVFSDDDGNVVSVEYAHADDYHVNTFIAPATGREMEFKSKLLVMATLPDGDDFKAWQCMNFLPRGTMYKTDNGKWMLLANGFSCHIYQQLPEAPARYREVYRGILCDSASVNPDYNSKWKKVKAPESGRHSIKKEKTETDESAR